MYCRTLNRTPFAQAPLEPNHINPKIWSGLALFSTASRLKLGPETTFMLNPGDYWVLLGTHGLLLGIHKYYWVLMVYYWASTKHYYTSRGITKSANRQVLL